MITKFVKVFHVFVWILPCLLSVQCAFAQNGWPEVKQETKPWTRWWWHGSAVTKEGITAEMEAYQKAGLGGLEITPIYGVVGYEKQFNEFLSPQWMDMLLHTLKEAKRLGLGIDMATGTGWPFGGPSVGDADACKDMSYKVYDLKGGSVLSEKIEFIQQPLLRAIGNLVYRTARDGVKPVAPRLDPMSIDIRQLAQPVSANRNLQELAIDQVKFERPLKLVALMGYSGGKSVDLFDKVDHSGKLNWIAPAGDWKLYAVFEGWHGKMVERAGPDGEGNVIDHFSATALKNYLSKFDAAFEGKDLSTLRSFFNDSYEVDDARGNADWTPQLFEEFQKRRGYDLRGHLPALFGKDSHDVNSRVLCDYRETVSEMLLENFTHQWRRWANEKGKLVRNQAHGSPANILDLYAAVDIPEIEGSEPLRIRMASSAANVTGKRLVSSESATWLDEHFLSSLSDIKSAVDKFLLNGVNHVFYHGTTYSPPGEAWPGWLFYAAVHLNPRNPQWRDFDALNEYVARCQSFLQDSQPDNDVLLYYPFYDALSTPGDEMLQHFDGIGKQFAGSSFEKAALEMQANGYQFDFISDKQIADLSVINEEIKTSGGGLYKTIVVPHCSVMPLRTLQKILSLAEEGAKVIFFEGTPTSSSGFASRELNQKLFGNILTRLPEGNRSISIGTGRIISSDNLKAALNQTSSKKEQLSNLGLEFIRKKKSAGNSLYMIVNSTNQKFEGWISPASVVGAVELFDPMSGQWGSAQTRMMSPGKTEVYVQLLPKQTIIVVTGSKITGSRLFRYYAEAGNSADLVGEWQVRFENTPRDSRSVAKQLDSWTRLGESYASFSGTATYTQVFKRPTAHADAWRLDLGSVHESAEVILNGKSIGTLIGPVYEVTIQPDMLSDENKLEIVVSNLMANRIADMDRKGVYWKKFYNVNIAARKPENRKGGIFDASNWKPRESGLLGPVRLIPLNRK